MARSYRRNFIETESTRNLYRDASAKVFTSWDFAITARKAAIRKEGAIRTELKV